MTTDAGTAGTTASESCRARYRVKGMADPGLGFRVLNLFVQRDLLPSRFLMVSHRETMLLSLHVEPISRQAAEIVAEKIRSLVTVTSVDLLHTDRTQAAAKASLMAANIEG